ncbi:MAG: Cof-type HAD-IIB family hydrolase [Actinomycetota bacterium]|nr:Cof-type HAD-IIB family hydrolase [Actinomycetota bacterium]
MSGGSTVRASRGAFTPRLVALDIDGTLVDAEERLTPAVGAAVTRAVRAGAHVVLSTGRSAFGIARIIDRLGLREGRVVASNGAVVYSYPPVTVLSTVTFDAREAVKLLLERVPDAAVAVEVIGRGYRVNKPFPEGEITGEMWIESVEELVAEPVTRVIIRDPSSSAEEFVELAAQLGLQGTNYYVGYTAWLDLAPEGVSKASALAEVAESLGVAQADVLAIGDGRNDVEMLAWAGRGVAMGGAPLEVQSAADDVTETWERDGVAHELRRWY